MVPNLTLTRPTVTQADLVGTDGLTDEERDAYAAEHRATVASRHLNPRAREAIERALHRRDGL